MESIQKILEHHFVEASWRQPAVILLDDLDYIAPAPRGPEQEMSGEAFHHTKIASGIQILFHFQLIIVSKSKGFSGVVYPISSLLE